ncbi:uncharacterized protein YKR070W [Phalaenopsis equestris]|uniref:uncharacterized protein YKR070W n=1 Tax=Phalaenopsis equestris TaxID=78828 RepID=UPI0009E55EC0|nr:uncharacterized protein YKR070W [Phalaenopsis equestris]
MRFRSFFRASQIKASSLLFRRLYSHSRPQGRRPSFGIAFDIDGVIIRGGDPIGGSPQALSRLYAEDGSLKIPYIFLTNGGGVPESKRACELSGLLGVQISPLQVVLGHSPFRNLLSRFENDLIVAVGKGEPAKVMLEYGFKKVLSIDDYASFLKDIDPLSQYKSWRINQIYEITKNVDELHSSLNVDSDAVKATFIVSDPVDWGRDIQVLCDILSCGGLPGKAKGHQPALYFASDDLQYQAAFPSERLGMGAFRIALESIFNRVNNRPLHYTSFGKPNPFVFKNAESVLMRVASTICGELDIVDDTKENQFRSIYMIGDNPIVDIDGAAEAGRPWFSILTRTGVFKGRDNHQDYPADLVVENVQEAVEFILKKEAL